MNPGAHTGLYCIFGKPVRHSLSPSMHNAAFRELNLDSVYLAFEPASIGLAVDAMRTLPVRGASVTIPFKISVMEYCDRIDGLAQRIGAVNTLLNDDGIITGYNTDGYGALKAIEHSGVRVRGAHFLIIGNGGAARAISFTLIEQGARITVTGRNPSKIDSLAKALDLSGDNATSNVLQNLTLEYMQTIDVVINTTPLGMSPKESGIPIPESLLSPSHAVMDIVYSPRITRFLSAARNKGCRTIEGFDMLLYQGVRQFEIWTGIPAPEAVMRRALTEKFAGYNS
jgi:shikimate dehydrogenase